MKNNWKCSEKLNKWRNEKGVVIIKHPNYPLYATTEELHELYIKEINN